MTDDLVKRANEAAAALAVYGSDDDQKVADLLFNLRVRIEALTKERDEAMQLLQTLSNMNGDLSRDMSKTKLLLAKAVEGLREIAGECGCSTARATLAEIEGEKE